MSNAAPLPLIEIGWLLAGEMDNVDRREIEAARDRLLAYLRRVLPDFVWSMPMLQRTRLVQKTWEEPVTLLEAASAERDAHHWDFVVVLTDAELISHYTSYALGMPARALGAAILSTAHLEPALVYGQEPADKPALMSRRIERLVMHLFGHLNGLHHCNERDNAMWRVRVAADLDGILGYDEKELAQLRAELHDVADVRLEEAEPGLRHAPLRFYLQAAWLNRDEIWSSVRQIAPWKFPLRFARLTLAAVSTLVVFVITAEAWDLAMSQRRDLVVAFTLLGLLGGTTFVLQRHRLLVRRPARLTEQTVVTNVSMALAVTVGMLNTWLLLFALVLFSSHLFFSEELVMAWAPSLDAPPGLERYLVFSAFVATLGLLVGALGASFEPGGYFRHVAYIDEET